MTRPKKDYKSINCKINKRTSDMLEDFIEKTRMSKTATVEQALLEFMTIYIPTIYIKENKEQVDKDAKSLNCKLDIKVHDMLDEYVGKTGMPKRVVVEWSLQKYIPNKLALMKDEEEEIKYCPYCGHKL